jgi:F-type H+-transporting ATPase subunit a
MPHIQVPGEIVFGPINLPLLGNFNITNTLIAIFIADLVLILMAISVRRATRRGELFLNGILGIVEMIIGGIYELVESTNKKWASHIFPWVATIILLVLVTNFINLIPGVETFGLIHEPHLGSPVYETEELFSIGDFTVTTITEEIEAGKIVEYNEGGSHQVEVPGMGFVPFVRAGASDLNFTLALALISVSMTQVLGVRALGPRYFSKFIDFKRFGQMWTREKLGPFDLIMPFIDIFVGLLEMIAEFAKILSFSFRLFGNIFAGGVLLAVIGTIVPVLVPSVFYALELFVGVIQALVFGILTLVFMSMATQGHDEHGQQEELAGSY